MSRRKEPAIPSDLLDRLLAGGDAGSGPQWRSRMNAVLQERPDRLPMAVTCQALGLNRSTVYAHGKRSLTEQPSRTSR
jgi:hypothetical protein